MKPKTSFGRHLFAGFVMVVVGMWTMVYAAENQTRMVVNVGVVLDLNSSIGKMALSCIHLSLSDFYVSHPHHNTTIVLHIKDSKGDVLQAAAQAVELVQKTEVEAILGRQESSSEAYYFMKLGEKAEIPIISFSPTISALTYLKTPYFFQVAQNHSSQVYAISDIVKAFGWRQIVAIYQDDEFGKWIIADLMEALQDAYARVHQSVIDLGASDDQIGEELYRLKTMQTRVFVVHMVQSLATRVFAVATKIGMMNEGYVWILTGATSNVLNTLNFSTLKWMQGVLGVKTYIPWTVELENFIIRWRRKFRQDNPGIEYYPQVDVYGLWTYDAMWALATAVETIGTDTNFTSTVSQNGKKISESLLKTKFRGISGEFSLAKGHLESPNLEVVNVIANGESTVGYWTPEVGLTKDFNLNSNLRPIIWPGYSIKVPKGWGAPLNGEKKLRIGVPLNVGFGEFARVVNGSMVGYCIDMFDAAVAQLPYNLSYEYIPYVDTHGQTSTTYDDLIVQVSKGKFDAAVGDITIIANRLSFVDFTFPFTETGISLVVPVRHKLRNRAWFFLKPLTWDLWIAILCFFVFMGFVVWILEHQINEDFRGPPAHQIGTSLWFSFCTIVFAQRETLLSNLARFVVVIWLVVVFILTQSYTASLTSWLTVLQLQPVTDVIQLTLRNVGYQKGSYVLDILHMFAFRNENLVPYASLEQLHELFIKGSRNGGIDAAIDEIPYIKLLLSKHPEDYTVLGFPYNSNGFGFAFPRGSSLVDDISKAVLNVTQSDTDNFREIQVKWFGNQIRQQPARSSSSLEASSSSLDLSYFSVLFLITTFAALFALKLYFIRFICNQRRSLGRYDSSSTMWRRIAAAIHIFRLEDDRREGQIDTEPPMAVAVAVDEASPSSTNAPSSPSNDSVRSLQCFNEFGDLSH